MSLIHSNKKKNPTTNSLGDNPFLNIILFTKHNSLLDVTFDFRFTAKKSNCRQKKIKFSKLNYGPLENELK